MTRWVEETFHPHWRVRLEASKVLHEVKTEHQHLVIFENPTWGTVLMLDGVCQLTTSDEFVYHEMMAHVPLMALAAPKRVLVIGGGDGGVLREVLKHPSVAKATLCEIDRAVDRPFPQALSADRRRVPRRCSRRRGHRRRAQIRGRDAREVRRHHRRQLRADRSERRAAHARVLHRLQARPEERRHPRHAERPAVPVPRAPARQRPPCSPRCSSGWRPTCARSRATSAVRSRSTSPPTTSTCSSWTPRTSPSASSQRERRRLEVLDARCARRRLRPAGLRGAASSRPRSPRPTRRATRPRPTPRCVGADGQGEPSRGGRRAQPRLKPFCASDGQVLRPALVALVVQRLQVGPGVEPGVVAVVEDDAHGVVADRLQLLDLDVALSGRPSRAARANGPAPRPTGSSRAASRPTA